MWFSSRLHKGPQIAWMRSSTRRVPCTTKMEGHRPLHLFPGARVLTVEGLGDGHRELQKDLTMRLRGLACAVSVSTWGTLGTKWPQCG